MYGKDGSINADSYVQNGLVFQLDGIEWGNVAGHWIERKNGYDFYEHAGKDLHTERDCMVFDGSSWFLCDDTIADYPDSTHSIEGVVYGMGNGWNAVLSLKTNNVAFWTDSTGKFCGAKGTAKPAGDNRIWGDLRIDYAYMFGNKFNISGLDYTPPNTLSRAQYGKPTVGALEGTNAGLYHAPNGQRYYAIRIYNRELTPEEIQHNFQIDRIRFNFPET